MKNNKQQVMKSLVNKVKDIKNAVIDKTSDILSGRSGYEADRIASDRQYKMYKMVNDAKGVADKGNESDPLFRARNMMRSAQQDALKNKVK